MKQKLVQLFTDHRAESILTHDEINALIQYLEKCIPAFDSNKLKKSALTRLVRKSTVMEIQSDNIYFSHNLD